MTIVRREILGDASRSRGKSSGIDMREAADAGVAPPYLPSSGADQSGVRVYNERLVLSLARRHGQLSKIEVARMTGLSV